VVLEQCAFDGSVQHDHLEGRQLNPGHAIEGAWFIIKEGVYQKNQDLQKLGCTMLDWMWDRGWDEEYGGIIYFRDLDGKSCSDYWHDMKFWWPQNEAVIANLYAYHVSGKENYLDNFCKAHEYFHKLFPDDEYGECYGYFHRDGRRSTDLKGNMYKGPFHTPRMYLEGAKLLDALTAKK
ncbi:MAG: AGE family epimerase/isomerase, partial [Spirochaetales bacterium]